MRAKPIVTLLTFLSVLISCATPPSKYSVAYQAMQNDEWDKAHDLFLPLAQSGNDSAMTNLAYLEDKRGNSDESDLWTKLAALSGNEVSIDYLGDNAPKSLLYGSPLNDSILMCDVLMDSVQVLPDIIALKFKLLTKYSSHTEFSVNSILENTGENGFSFDVHRNRTYYIPGDGFVVFTGFVESGATSATLSLTCDGDTSVVNIPLRDSRITEALRSFGGESLPKNVAQVQMTKAGGVYEIPVTINGVLEINFILDSGASEIFISSDVASTLFKTGTVDLNDLLPDQQYVLADGSTVTNKRFKLRSVEIGGKVFHDIPCAIANDISAPMLLGQSVLEKLGKFSVDYESGVITFD